MLLTGCAEKSSGRPYDDGWREAYAKVLRGTTAKRFSLVYIDNDEIPELTLHWSDEGLATGNDQPKLYIYNSMHEAEDMGSITDGGLDQFGYLERNGIVVSAFISSGAGYCNYLRFADGTLAPEHEIRIDASGTHSTTAKYMLDGNDCTDKEYEKITAKYHSDSYRCTTGDYAVNEDNILNYVMEQ